MALLFGLRGPDVRPADDRGIRAGVALLDGAEPVAGARASALPAPRSGRGEGGGTATAALALWTRRRRLRAAGTRAAR